MYRNTTVGSLPLGLSSRLLAQRFVTLFACVLAFCAMALFGGLTLQAQSTSGGGITGTVLDPMNKVVVKAQVTATNTDTGVQFTRQTTSEGLYSIAPLPVGTYNVEVVAKGFQRLLQENVQVDNASMFGLNLKLTVGGESTTITVTDAPPYMNTTDATMGGTIENQLYSSLPLTMSGGPRDPTAFQYLMPGVQENPGNTTNQGVTAGASGIYGGSGATNLNQNYVEGMPVNSVADNSQGSGAQVATAVSVDAVNQFSVNTSSASTSFGGAGSANYTINSGGNQFHGTVFDFVRNTAFDTWGYFSKVANAATGFAGKPGEHQNSYGVSVGGPILKDKLFFFGSYEGYRYTKISNTPQTITIPTMSERTGNFTDVFGTVAAQVDDPLSGVNGSRTPYTGLENGVPTFNVMPNGTNGQASPFSNISLAMASALPPPTNLATASNYFAVLPQANNDYDFDVKIDYTMNSRNKFELTSLAGVVGYGGAPDYTSYSQLPIPYAGGTFTNQKTATGIFKYTYIASQSLINSLSYGYTRNWGEGFSLTKGTPFAASNLGINNLPAGNGADDAPTISFSAGTGTTAPATWTSTSSTGPKGSNTFTLQDNLTWIKNRHNFTFGLQIQWLETNQGSYGGFSQSIGLTYAASTSAGPGNGDAYASFLVGSVNSDSIHTQSITDIGGRYRPIAPYIQDNWQVTPKLTVNLGLRYDYLQPYHEVHDRISFLNPAIINPIVGIPGVLEFAGFPNIKNFTATTTAPVESAAQELAMYSPYICQCTTPVHPYNQNLQPRISFAYAYNPSTVFSGAFGLSVTHAGGVGGGGSATAATGNNGEFTSSSSAPAGGSTGTGSSFFLTNYLAANATPPANVIPPQQGTEGQAIAPAVLGPTIPCVVAGTCNPFTAIPSWTAAGENVNPLNTTGDYNFSSYFADASNDYNCSASGTFCSPQGVNFADPYYGGRGPQFISYNAGIQRMLNKKAVFTINYAGTQTHFLPGGAGRGTAQNTFSPDYDEKLSGALLYAFSGANSPYPLVSPSCTGLGLRTQGNCASFGGSSATLAKSLDPYPQFGGFTDIWGDTGNSNYNSLQLMVTQRPWHNLSGFIDYTRAKEIDNIGTHRTQYPLGPQDGNFTQYMSANRVDRGLGTSSQTNAFNLTWVYTFPIGRGQAFFATNRIMGAIGGGWSFNGIYKYRDGVPLQISNGGGCMSNAIGGQGTCLPDYVQGFNKKAARINGRWGRGPGANAQNYTQTSYLNTAGYECADSSANNPTYTCGTTTEPNTTFKIGNLARSAPYGLHGPGWWDIDLGLRRSFNVRETATLHLTFEFEADVTNATNSTFFNIASTTWDTAAFGQVGGQNQNVQPRDWQFAGRFRF